MKEILENITVFEIEFTMFCGVNWCDVTYKMKFQYF